MGSRVLLVDDHALLRKGLRLVLEEEEDLEVVGEAGDGREAIELFRELEPDVVVMDISMKGMNGIEATRQIVSEIPDTKVVALSIHSGSRYVEGMLNAGATGYILKESAHEDLIDGIRTVMSGEVFLSTAITGILVSQYRSNLKRPSFMDRSGQLTVRNKEILRLLVAGDSDIQIAAALRLEQDSVATARRRLMDDLGARDDAEFTEIAGTFLGLADRVGIDNRPKRGPESKTVPTLIRNTKLHRPPVPENHLRRLRLMKMLDKGRDLPLTLISAPAGYGKSQLASCWTGTSGLPTAWLSLGEDDDDLRQFLRYVLAAVGSLFPDAAEASESLVNASILPPLSVIIDTLTNDLDWVAEDFVLVLDDFHHIHNEPVHDLLAELLRHPPRPLHLMLITRRDPALTLTRLRANHQVNEVRTRDL